MLCKAAHLVAYKSSREKARQRFHAGEITIKHGTNNAYCYYNCRCDECRAAHTKSYAVMEARKKARAKSKKAATKSKSAATKSKVAAVTAAKDAT